MTTAVVVASDGLMKQMSDLVHHIDQATAEEAKSAYDRIGLAREWAKLQEDAANLAERITWLEAVILRRIGQVDPKILPGPRRAASRHFATLDDGELSTLLNDFPARSAVSAYNLWAKAEGVKASRRRGQQLISNTYREKVDEDDLTPQNLRYVIDSRTLTVRQAAAVILDHYASNLTSSTVAYVVDEFIAEEAPISESASPLEVSAFRAGLAEAVRGAFAVAPVDTTERSWELPAYITTYDEETDQWLRIPSEFATVGDAQRMLALRRGQMESLRRSYENLERVFHDRLAVDRREPDEYLRDDMTAMTRRMAADEQRKMAAR